MNSLGLRVLLVWLMRAVDAVPVALAVHSKHETMINMQQVN